MQAMPIGVVNRPPRTSGAGSSQLNQKRRRQAQNRTVLPSSPVVAVLMLLAMFMALAALAAWSKVNTLDRKIARARERHDSHENRANLCTKILNEKQAALGLGTTQPGRSEQGRAQDHLQPIVEGQKISPAGLTNTEMVVAANSTATSPSRVASEVNPIDGTPVDSDGAALISPSALIFVVGHLRHFEFTLPTHRKLVQSVEKALGATPAVCVATYPYRDHHDRTWWHGGDQTADTSVQVDPDQVAASYQIPRAQVQMLEPTSVQNPTKYMDFVQQQTKISFNVHVGTFTSIALGYTACTQALAPTQFDVIIRTRPDSEFNLGMLKAALTKVKARSTEVIASGCMRRRSIVGGDFSEVAFVASRQFFELFVRDFDVYRMYDELFARPCVPFQKGQPKERATRGKDRSDRCALWTQQSLQCKVNEPPPCSFTPETFLKTWMNSNGVATIPLGKGGLSMVRNGGRKTQVCT